MDKIEHLQKVLLLIVKDIDELCRKNNITYFLDGGTAIGAVRHKGFIPWDDDLDIIMDTDNYEKFIKVCREQLDNDKYYVQEGLVDWALDYSKIKLRGTNLKEYESSNSECNGIFIDVFRCDNISDCNIVAKWQYFCSKILLSYQLSKRTYKSATFIKKLVMFLSFPLRFKSINNFFYRQVKASRNKQTKRVCVFFGGITWKSSVFDRDIYGIPKYVKFEDTLLPVQEHCHEYLTQIYGNYMQLPPVEKRVPLHSSDVDFGIY